MGLGIFVGLFRYSLSSIEELLPGPERTLKQEVIEWANREETRINATLRAAGLAEHHEPREPRDGAPWTYRIGSYGCLHLLRRIAAHLALGHGMPPPDLIAGVHDPIHDEYCRASGFRRLRDPSSKESLSPESPFPRPAVVGGWPSSHLFHHSGATGEYVPNRFPHVLVPDPKQGDGTDWLGSSFTLQAECQVLAQRLELPPEIELAELDRLRTQAAELLRGSGWQRYIIECFVCRALLTACEISIRSGSAILFS